MAERTEVTAVPSTPGPAADGPPRLPADVLAGLPTPCLVVDLAAARRNIARLDAYYAASEVVLRPHFKAHKCSSLLRLQVADDLDRPVTCATAWEAETLAARGFRDILVANEVVGAAGLAALGRAATEAAIMVAADSRAHVEAYRSAAERFGVELGVLIEIDVGMGRCGLAPGDAWLPVLAKSIAETPGLRFRGLQAYEGHAVALPTRAERAAEVRRSAAVLDRARRRLADIGLHCEIVSGGGTGTFDLAAESGVWNEVQAGTYVLMEGRYGALDLPFEVALYCCAHVISRPTERRIVVNAGLKALSPELGPPSCLEPCSTVAGLADEHARVAVPAESALEVGDAVLLVPRHLDPTVNLHDTLFVWDERDGLSAWEVDGRATGREPVPYRR